MTMIILSNMILVNKDSNDNTISNMILINKYFNKMMISNIILIKKLKYGKSIYCITCCLFFQYCPNEPTLVRPIDAFE